MVSLHYKSIFGALIATSLTLLPLSGGADVYDDIGLTALENFLGNAMPSGVGVAVSQVEARTISNNYRIDTTLPSFTGKTIIDQSAQASGISSHSTTVGDFWYGNTIGIAPGITDIDLYNASDWAVRQLSLANGGEPLVETSRIQNHSWIANRNPDVPLLDAITLIRRFDYVLNRDDVTGIVTVNNGTDSGIPDLLSHSYNAISVGVSDGDHSIGETVFDHEGRSKPDIVAPDNNTSFAAPLVSGSVALLLETIDGFPLLSNAQQPEVMKALLLSGATKNEFSTWSNSASDPLDDTFGAGELNVFNSYKILATGEVEPGTPPVPRSSGWDFNTSDLTTPKRYVIEVPKGMAISEFTATLNWHRIIFDMDPGAAFDPDAFVGNLDLHVYRGVDGQPVERLASSTSPVDNVEHLFLPALGEGQFILEVQANSNVDYGLAFRSELIPTPTILRISPKVDGGMDVTADVEVGQAYRLERSSDFAHWTTVHNLSATASEATFQDALAPDGFNAYRVVLDL
jgi:hypothetical protein